MDKPKRSAFVTTRKGFCYLTIKSGGRNFDILRIRQYKIEAQEKRDLRRAWPDVAFDWKKLEAQLVDKRLACRGYRARRRSDGAAARRRGPDSFAAVYEPSTRTVYVDRMPRTIAGAGALLDAVLEIDRKQSAQGQTAPSADSRKVTGNSGPDGEA
jgi:hypothetical protein